MSVHIGNDVIKEQQRSHDREWGRGELLYPKEACRPVSLSSMQNASTCLLFLPPQNPVYNWSPKTQGIIFSSIFYGILIIQIPVGYLSEKYSIKKMIGSGLFLSSLFSLILPMAAEGGEAWIIACRAAQGVFQVLK